MIVCSNCAHPNPDGAAQCSACYSPLPATRSCPSCGAQVQVDASFCGHCGAQLGAEMGAQLGDLREASPTFGRGEGWVEAGVSQPEGATSPMQAPAASTHLQAQRAYLQHAGTSAVIELPSHLSLIHIGKPNDRVPPDIDVSGFPHSEVVSRIHADIRIEGEAYYLEDTGSSNGTYVNNLPIAAGNRHRLRPGDRVALGKEDKVSFLFQILD